MCEIFSAFSNVNWQKPIILLFKKYPNCEEFSIFSIQKLSGF
jgi:hypothetical protein